MMVVVARDPSLWVQLVLYFSTMVVASHFLLATQLEIASVQKAVFASIWAPFSWVVFSRLEYRHRLLSRLFCGHRRVAQVCFAVYVLAFSIYREHVFALAMAETPRNQYYYPVTILPRQVIETIGTVLYISGSTLNFTGFFHVHLNTYYPEYFGFIQLTLVTAFPYNCMSHPMYVGAAVAHVGYSMRILSPTALYLAGWIALGYWTVAKIFEDPFMEIFYPCNVSQKQNGTKLSQPPKLSNGSLSKKRTKSNFVLDFCAHVLWHRIWRGSSKLQDGTLLSLNSDYSFRRYVRPTDPTIIKSLTLQLATVCRESIGDLLPYPIFRGESYRDKLICLVYPKGSSVPCGFNVSIQWQYQKQVPCLHMGLIMVHPQHRGRDLQSLMGLTNLALFAFDHADTKFWVTDLGRSASGSKNFYSFFKRDICPYPTNNFGKSCPCQEPHLSIAKSFYANFQKDAGISENSKLEGFVVKGSNGPGGAEALIHVQHTTRSSQSSRFNAWIDKLCPDATDEVIMVGRIHLWWLMVVEEILARCSSSFFVVVAAALATYLCHKT